MLQCASPYCQLSLNCLCQARECVEQRTVLCVCVCVCLCVCVCVCVCDLPFDVPRQENLTERSHDVQPNLCEVSVVNNDGTVSEKVYPEVRRPPPSLAASVAHNRCFPTR